MNNFVTFNYNSTISSDLSTKKILMLGRANDKKKDLNLEYYQWNILFMKSPNVSLIFFQI